jgi:CubicO group peptidase (beta-lactamase class C family)
MKKFIRVTLIVLVLLVAAALSYVLITFPPVMAGMAAKTMCSCVYVTGRTPESVREKELQVFPGLSSLAIELSGDSTVNASLLWHTSKAIYRKGLGCTLLAERSEEEVRQQKVNLPVPPAVDQDTVSWPAGNVLPEQTHSGNNHAAMMNVVEKAFQDADPENPVFTHAVVVVYDGQIIAEKYADGFDQNSRLMGWSMTKSIANALIGILVKEGKLTIEAPAPVGEWKNDERKEITLNNLLQASSGLAWSESYFLPTSEFHKMFIHSDDKAAYAASRSLEKPPGTFFEYSSGTTNILSRMIRQTVGDEEYYRFPYEKLFYKIGMHHAIVEPDASGTFVASSYGFASARDWARFGMLYLNDGMWNGERILPEGWVNYTTTPAPAALDRQYGAQVWLNQGNPQDTAKVEYEGLPHEAIIFDGFERNFVVIVPSKKLVVVRLGVTHNKNFSLANLVNGAIEVLR